MEIYLTNPTTKERIEGPFQFVSDAQQRARTLTEINPGMRITLSEVWGEDELSAGRAREEALVAEGTLVPVPDWFPSKPEHYVRQVEGDSYILSMLLNDRALATNRRTVISASAYLARYGSGNLASQDVSALCQRYAAWCLGMGALVVTSDQDTIFEAYVESGIGSCMSMQAPNGDKSQHPCMVYGGESDLHMAFVRGKRGKIMARAIVNSVTDQYYSIYSVNPAAYHHLQAELNAAGYTCTAQAFKGARLNKIESKSHKGYFVMAYVDGYYGHVDKNFVIGGDAYMYVQTTAGIVCPPRP